MITRKSFLHQHKQRPYCSQKMFLWSPFCRIKRSAGVWGVGTRQQAQVQCSAREKQPGWDARGMQGQRRLDPPGRATESQISPAGTELTPGMLSSLLPLPKPLARIRDSQKTVESQEGLEKAFLMKSLALGSRWASLLPCSQHWTRQIFPPGQVTATAFHVFFKHGRSEGFPAHVAQHLD